MTDGGAASAIGAGAEVLGAGGGGDEGGGGGGGAAAPEWLGGLPEELRGDATLSRYKSVEELARGHIETKRLATSKLAIPGEGAKPEEWGAVWDALGRPKAPTDYEIPVGEGGAEGPMAEAFRPLAHQLGLNKGQAKGLAEFFNAQTATLQEGYYAKGAEEIAALKGELGAEYDGKVAAARAVYARLGFPPEFADQLDQKVGSAGLLKGFIRLAEVTGEHGLAGADGGGGGFAAGDANAEAQLGVLYKDAGWREKLNKGDAATVAQHNRLMAAAKAQAVKPR
jgi:hypothetical protein